MALKRLVDVAVERDTPLDVLAALREVHPAAELVYVGNGVWWLGYMLDTAAMHVGYPPPNHIAGYQYQLQRQGFRWLGAYGDAYALSPSYMRGEIEFMFGRTDAELNGDFYTAECISDGSAKEREQIQAQVEMAQQNARSIFAHAIRKRRGVLFPSGGRILADGTAISAPHVVTMHKGQPL